MTTNGQDFLFCDDDREWLHIFSLTKTSNEGQLKMTNMTITMTIIITTTMMKKVILESGRGADLKVTGAGYEDASLCWRFSNEHLLRWGSFC